MITELRLERDGVAYTYDLDLPYIPEGALISCKYAAAARIISNFIRINEEDIPKQYLVAR